LKRFDRALARRVAAGLLAQYPELCVLAGKAAPPLEPESNLVAVGKVGIKHRVGCFSLWTCAHLR